MPNCNCLALGSFFDSTRIIQLQLQVSFQTNYPPKFWHGTRKWWFWKGISYPRGWFSGSIWNFRGVSNYKTQTTLPALHPSQSQAQALQATKVAQVASRVCIGPKCVKQRPETRQSHYISIISIERIDTIWWSNYFKSPPNMCGYSVCPPSQSSKYPTNSLQSFEKFSMGILLDEILMVGRKFSTNGFVFS